MTTTIKVTATAVCEGYDYVGSRISNKREYWVNIKLNSAYHKESAQTYEELARVLKAKFGMILPDKRGLRWFNYGAPYNTAEI